MRARIAGVIREAADSVRIYTLGAGCEKVLAIIGQGEASRDEEVDIIRGEWKGLTPGEGLAVGRRRMAATVRVATGGGGSCPPGRGGRPCWLLLPLG